MRRRAEVLCNTENRLIRNVRIFIPDFDVVSDTATVVDECWVDMNVGHTELTRRRNMQHCPFVHHKSHATFPGKETLILNCQV